MASIFTVQCPRCAESFPCHTELWQAGYDLLCPFCQESFPQDASPRVVSAGGDVQTRDTGAAEGM